MPGDPKDLGLVKRPKASESANGVEVRVTATNVPFVAATLAAWPPDTAIESGRNSATGRTLEPRQEVRGAGAGPGPSRRGSQ
jgi:hypothetical protein